MSYEVNGVEYDYWSAKNQRILDKLVNREVFCCMTSEVEYMLSKVPDYEGENPFDEDDICVTMNPYCDECETADDFEELTVAELKDDDFISHNKFDAVLGVFDLIYYCPICGFWYDTIDEARDCCGRDTTVYKCRNCGKVFNEDEHSNLDTRPAEIYEWWAVSKWFGEKLAEQGCVIIDSWGKSYWGRTTTGQSISLDGCIARIAENMGILEGMEHKWEV